MLADTLPSVLVLVLCLVANLFVSRSIADVSSCRSDLLRRRGSCCLIGLAKPAAL